MKTLLHNSILICCLVALGFCPSGCGQTTNHISVTGRVLLDDEPLPDGWITFFGERGAAGSGKIENGSFRLQESGSQSGILPGTYQVAIESWKEKPGVLSSGGSISTGVSNIPKKWASPKTSGLSANVQAGKTSFEFAISSKL